MIVVYFLHMILRSSQIQVQKPILAPSMQQSIEVLLLPLTELSQQIEVELQENPMLEIEDQTGNNESNKIEQMLDQSIDYLRNHAHKVSTYEPSMDDDTPEGKQISQVTCLEDYLLQQLHLELNNPADIRIGEFIIGNLNEDGYLKCSIEEIARLLGIKDFDHIEHILKTIQHFDPLGIASRDLKECLCVQVPFYFNGKSNFMTELIEGHLENLGKKKYQDIARAMKTPQDEIKSYAQMITRLEPKPARKYRNTEHNPFVKPDVTVTKNEDDTLSYVVNNERIPNLRISATYRNFLNKANLTQEESEYIREKIKGGLLFIKSIEQRQETIRGIAEFIVNHQKEFFFEGTSALKPMILKDVAQKIDRNESTVSRAINNKYVDTPQGLVPMKFFFSQGVSQASSETSISNRCIQEQLKNIVDAENKTKPYSDQDLVNMLKSRGVNVARRTITKYRKALKILPSNLRKI